MNLSSKIDTRKLSWVIEFLSEKNLDIRNHRDGRWIAQKCTPDVVAFISECILEYIENSPQSEFTIKNIWDSQHFMDSVADVFTKPSTQEPTASSEYDKFIGQPIKMLSRAGILSCRKIGTKCYYKLENEDLLMFISMRELNALYFIYLYIYETFTQSHFISNIDNFLKNNTKENYTRIKSLFFRLQTENTRINGELESNRIFTKVLNPITFMHNARGSEKGRLSKFPTYFVDLMYNRPNFRDYLKQKNITRQQFDLNPDFTAAMSPQYRDYIVKKDVKIYHNFNSEVDDELNKGRATQAHHIFMKSAFPQLSDCRENIITLTPSQHLTKAHPNNNTQIIDEEYQYLCLIHKLESVNESISQGDNFYCMEKYNYVVNTGKSEINILSNDTPQIIRNKLALAYRASS